ncbi:MAG: hypothetical protein EBR82_23580 [Caulobacteraceae bacterium]|nr:hypothetical protein [Caulobacteraceae bacterium]
MSAAIRLAGNRQIASNLLGGDELIFKLQTLGPKIEGKTLRAGIRKALRIIVRGIQGEIPGGMSPIRQLVYGTQKAKRKTLVEAKAGYGVGKTNKIVLPRGIIKRDAAERPRDSKGRLVKGEIAGASRRRGVGIAGKNIHWFALGTQKMAPLISENAVRSGYQKSRAAAGAALENEIFNALSQVWTGG